jgi:hypothetical protein
MSDDRPPLNPRAKQVLEEYQRGISNKIRNTAEKKVLDVGGTEIGERDMLEATKQFSIMTSSKLRKSVIAVLVMATFALLSIQIGAFFSLPQNITQTLPVIFQLGLITPSFIVLVLMIAFAITFREDWLP